MKGLSLILIATALTLCGCSGGDEAAAANVGTAKPAPIASKPGAQMSGVSETMNPAAAPAPGSALGNR